ncbi:MAG: DUF4105 domain-containing protein [Paludibacter sp.]|nr:DUF4105 domain-containing protein [Paludibacter sp.]
MKKNFILFLLTLTITSGFSVNSQIIRVTDSTRISLVTCSPYQSEVYAKFGHTGLRVFDASQNIDMLFNWGIFSFDTKHFYAKFIIGYCDYMLGVVDTEVFLKEYRSRESSVVEQVLNLNMTEKTDLIDLLSENCQPQNREYRYNFVFDNCATRPRDLIIHAVNCSAEHLVLNNLNHTQLTYRDLVSQYVGRNTWLMFGIDLIFGANSDIIPSQNQAMFLPEIFANEFADAKIVNDSTTERNIVSKQSYLVPQVAEKYYPNANNFSFPFLTFFVILLVRIYFFVCEMKYTGKKYLKTDCSILIITGIVGCIAFFLTFISVHPLVGRNFNILWLMPLNMVVGVLIWFKPMRKILFFYFIVYLLLILYSLWIYAIGVQVINIASIPVILTMALVAISWIIRSKRAFRHTKYEKWIQKHLRF